MVMTWVISSPSSRIGILLSRKYRDLAAQRDLQLRLLDLAGLEHPVELGPELRRRLPGEHLEDRPAHHVVAPEALGAGLPLAVPALDPVVAVDDVEADRQAVDDEAGEAAVLLDLARLGRHLAGEVGRQLDRGEVGRQDVGHDRQELERPPSAPTRASSRPSRAPSCSSGKRRQPGPRRDRGQRGGRVGGPSGAGGACDRAKGRGARLPRARSVTASAGSPRRSVSATAASVASVPSPSLRSLATDPISARLSVAHAGRSAGDAVAARLRIRHSPSIRRSTRCSIHSPSMTEPATGSSRRVVSQTAARSPSCR